MAPPLAPDVREVVDETVEHFNANHADTVLLLARFAAGAAEASDAEAIAVDALGVDFEVRVGAGVAAPRSVARARFPAPAVTLEEIQTAVFGLIAEARQGAGEDVPLTSLEREAAGRGTLPTFVTRVRAVAELTPNLREVVIGGPELADFASAGGDQFFYVLVARTDDEPLPHGYTMADWMAADEATRPYGAYYTVRRWDRRAGRDHAVGRRPRPRRGRRRLVRPLRARRPLGDLGTTARRSGAMASTPPQPAGAATCS